MALEKLSRTPESDSVDIRIFLDSGSEARLKEVEYVRDTYLPTAEIFQAHTHVVAPSGAWNILNSLKAGWETGASFIYLVEEDVMVFPEFFKEHRRMQDSGDYFATCGRRCGHMPIDFFSNPGTCYRREKLAHVIPHINMQYFADLPGYIERHFPGMNHAGSWLDDGLIRRVQISLREKVLCPEKPIAAHQGFHYYNKLEQWTTRGTIQEKIEQLRKIIAEIDPTARYSRDFEPFKEAQ